MGLIDDCIGVWPAWYPAEYAEGDKTFEELDKGDIIYYCSNEGVVDEWEVYKPLHQSGDDLVLSIKRTIEGKKNDKRMKLNFGSLRVGNTHDSYKCSMITYQTYNTGYYGTNKNSVVNRVIKRHSEELEKLKLKVSSIENYIEVLKTNL